MHARLRCINRLGARCCACEARARVRRRSTCIDCTIRYHRMKRSLQLLQAFRYDDEAGEEVKRAEVPAKPKLVKLKRPKTAPKSKVGKSARARVLVTAPDLPDLPPMLLENLLLVFVGFNPGIESSRTQHHYAHPTNLFWKLFNRLELLLAAARAQHLQKHPLVAELCPDGHSMASAADDVRLVEVGIGFTDLVLRCTRAAHELSTAEKMANVPRVMGELQRSGASHVVVVGKGIWETMARALVPEMGLKNFVWGLQSDRRVVDVFYRQCGRHVRVYVVPSTSGLVALVPYGEKLAMWEAVARSVAPPEENSAGVVSMAGT